MLSVPSKQILVSERFSQLHTLGLHLCFAPTRRFLCGDEITEADVRLFPTLFRFDHVYFSRFLLNQTTIHDSYPALQASGWTHVWQASG